MIKLVFSISGMTCGGCVASVTRVLTSQPGVSNAQVTLSPGQAVVQFDPSLTSPDAIFAAVTKAGFTSKAQA